MAVKHVTFALLVGAAPVAAQDTPLSAIDWLNVPQTTTQTRVTPAAPKPPEAPVAKSAAAPQVDAQPLNAPTVGGVGLLPSSVTGFPSTLWFGSDERQLQRMLRNDHRREPAVPALDSLLHTLLLAEAEPPRGTDGSGLLAARIDALFQHGLVAPAEALLERVTTLTPELFHRAFDLSLLMGTDGALCQMLSAQPGLSADIPSRIWCITRSGDYARAATLYQTGKALGQLSRIDAELLLRFLDPDYAETAPPLRAPVRPTPLQFRLFEAIGEALPTASLPLPFAVVELTGDSGWRAQLQAAERLAKAGAIDGNQLLGAYTRQLRAASGGIWDRVEALQRFETALTAADPTAVSSSLVKVWPHMRTAGLLVPFANLFAAQLDGLPLSAEAARLAGFAALLSAKYESAADPLLDSDDPQLRFLAGLAKGLPSPDTRSDVPHAPAFIAAWSATPEAMAEYASFPEESRLGEALLAAITRFSSGAEGNTDDLVDALQTLRAFGLEDTARRAALQLAILDLESARR